MSYIKLFEQYASEQKGINEARKLVKQFASAMKLDIVDSPELVGLMNPEYGFMDFGAAEDGSFMAQFVINFEPTGWTESWYLVVYPEEKMFTLATDAFSVKMQGKNLELIEDDGWECLYKLQEWKKIKSDDLHAFMNDPEGNNDYNEVSTEEKDTYLSIRQTHSRFIVSIGYDGKKFFNESTKYRLEIVAIKDTKLHKTINSDRGINNDRLAAQTFYDDRHISDENAIAIIDKDTKKVLWISDPLTKVKEGRFDISTLIK